MRYKKPLIFAFSLLLLSWALDNCSNNTRQKSEVPATETTTDPSTVENRNTIIDYTVSKRETIDIPEKVQINTHVVVEKEDIDEESIRNLLIHLYEKERNTKNYKHGDRPSLIFIYAYATWEHAKAGTTKSLGMVSKNLDNGQPEIKINQSHTNPIIDHTVVKREIIDTPAKVQVSTHVVVELQNIDEESIRNLLNHLYRKELNTKNYKHSNAPSLIFIYAYATEEHAEAGMAQWIGMASTSFNSHRPKIEINQIQLNAPRNSNEVKFGLTESQRREVWVKLVKAEDNALKRADIQIPIDQPGTTSATIKRNSDLMQSLLNKYKNKLKKEYNLDEKSLQEISLEGFQKGWPFPKF